MRRHVDNTRWAIALALGITVGTTAISAPGEGAQKARMENYEDEAEDRIGERLEEFRLRRLEQAHERAAAAAATPTTTDDAVEREEVEELQDPFGSVIALYDSESGDGQDLEIRLTMPIEAFMDFAPIAALEAAAIPHKFPVVHIVLREETTDRVAHVAFKDAEPIAGRYLAEDADAIEEMREALIWH